MEMNDRADVVQGDRRNFFRVDDVLPLVMKRVDMDISCIKARMLFTLQSREENPLYPDLPPDENIPPDLWKILLDINSKLNFVLEVLHPESQSLSQARNIPVSLSASGIRLKTESPFDLGDLLELRMMLQLQCPLWLALYGHVVKKTPVADDVYDMAIRFCDMDEEIRDKISQYCLKRQREIIREQRG